MTDSVYWARGLYGLTDSSALPMQVFENEKQLERCKMRLKMRNCRHDDYVDLVALEAREKVQHKSVFRERLHLAAIRHVNLSNKRIYMVLLWSYRIDWWGSI